MLEVLICSASDRSTWADLSDTYLPLGNVNMVELANSVVTHHGSLNVYTI